MSVTAVRAQTYGEFLAQAKEQAKATQETQTRSEERERKEAADQGAGERERYEERVRTTGKPDEPERHRAEHGEPAKDTARNQPTHGTGPGGTPGGAASKGRKR